MPAKPILVADSEPHVRQALFEALTRQGYAVDLAETGADALEKFKANPFELVITDAKTPYLDGLELLKNIKKNSPHTPVIMVSAYVSVEAAVEAMREGALDYVLKPFSMNLIEEVVERALSGSGGRSWRSPGALAAPTGHREIITDDPAMKRLLQRALSVAPSKATVLLQGESGTGKELLARYIHLHSDRANGPFVAINCASLPEGLLESELFGHEKGAFTGAVTRKSGKFELADQGTILLDEISEMDLALQAKLLRVLQEGEVDRVGGKLPTKIDVRVIATTNRDIKAWVAEGKFRSDLYYRLNVIPLTIPPLRERPGDVIGLANFFLNSYSNLNKKELKTLSAAVVNRLKAHDWPGNVRELENMMARGVLLSIGSEVELGDLFLDEISTLPNHVAPTPDQASLAIPTPPSDQSPQGLMTIYEMEKDLVFRALNETEGNRTHAAKILGISVRTLRNKLAEYQGVSFDPAGN
ncbi:MAG: sigma-54-dependent Fis family transcriptional regulator [Deltaproteobacteria bacterium]|nr:sigma-54-dependent Fis family transcriptional regulator [Deltaproteobacteria bacterium]